MIYRVKLKTDWLKDGADITAGDLKPVRIVRAASEQHAREVAAEGEHYDASVFKRWRDESTEVEAIDPNGPPEVLL